MTKPWTPDEVAAAQSTGDHIPEHVIRAVNELLAKSYSNGRASFTQNELISLALELDPDQDTPSEVRRHALFTAQSLDVEQVYRGQGWLVEYDKPGYNESYSAIFSFTKCGQDGWPA